MCLTSLRTRGETSPAALSLNHLFSRPWTGDRSRRRRRAPAKRPPSAFLSGACRQEGKRRIRVRICHTAPRRVGPKVQTQQAITKATLFRSITDAIIPFLDPHISFRPFGVHAVSINHSDSARRPMRRHSGPCRPAVRVDHHIRDAAVDQAGPSTPGPGRRWSPETSARGSTPAPMAGTSTAPSGKIGSGGTDLRRLGGTLGGRLQRVPAWSRHHRFGALLNSVDESPASGFWPSTSAIRGFPERRRY